MQLRTFSKWMVVTGSLLIWILKLFIRPYMHMEGWLKFFCGVAPNLMGAYLVPFAAYWLYTHPGFYNGRLLRFPFFSDTRMVCLFGFSLAVINEYLQLIPFFKRTFDYYDMLFSAFGLVIACYHFTALQRRTYFV